jgi:flagellar protein FlgJ
MVGADLPANFAFDVHGIDALKLKAKTAPDQAARGVAQQFEALFLSMMLKSMRDATPQDGLFDNDQTKLYNQLMDQTLAQKLSSGKGIGLADVIARQLGANVATTPSDLLPRIPAGLASPRAAGQVSLDVAPLAANAPAEFANKLWPQAVEAAQSIGIPPHFLIGHAALESGWGQHEIRGADGSNSYNLFGIKAGADWKGPVVETVSTEYVNGVPQKSVQRFRAYASYAEGFRDYAALLRNNPRYASMFGQPLDAAGFAQGLQKAGYATDPLYAGKLERILGGETLRRALSG